VQSVTENGDPWLPNDIFRKSSSKISLTPLFEDWNQIEAARTKCALPQLSSITAEASLDKANAIFTTPIRTDILEEQPESEWEFVSMHARLVGLLCHGVLERIDFKSPKHFRALLETEKAKLTDAHSLQALNEAESEAELILEKFFKSEAAQWLCALEIKGREIPVCVFDSVQNKVLTGTIDLLAKDASNQHFLIDYKTVDDLDDDSLATYQRQMKLYSMAITVPCVAKLCLLRSGKIIDL
jgi:hypothetical protein